MNGTPVQTHEFLTEPVENSSGAVRKRPKIPFILLISQAIRKTDPRTATAAKTSLGLKVISRSFNLHRDYSNSLTLSNAGDLSWS